MTQNFDYMAMLPLVAIFVIFYFMLIRPQQKKMKEHQQLLANLRRGDKVVTGGGVIGTIYKLTSDREVLVEVAEGVKLRIVRGMITEVLSKTEAVNSDKASSSKKEETTAVDKKD